jgi:hypothetical protein
VRVQPFLNELVGLPFAKASVFANNPNFSGGWEGWLQAEIGYAIYGANISSLIRREVKYPDGAAAYLNYVAGPPPVATPGAAAGAAARCVFYLHRPAGPAGGGADETYIELKCINPTVANPINDAWNRFDNDVVKIGALRAANGTLVCQALLATFGTFTPIDVAAAAPLSIYWGGTRSAYILDTGSGNVTTLQTVTTGGVPRLFIVAVSV